MGDCQDRGLRVQFDRRLKLKFLGSMVTTDAGLLACRELDAALGLTKTGEEVLADSRLGSNQQHRLVPVIERYRGYDVPKFGMDKNGVTPSWRPVVSSRRRRHRTEGSPSTA